MIHFLRILYRQEPVLFYELSQHNPDLPFIFPPSTNWVVTEKNILAQFRLRLFGILNNENFILPRVASVLKRSSPFVFFATPSKRDQKYHEVFAIMKDVNLLDRMIQDQTIYQIIEEPDASKIYYKEFLACELVKRDSLTGIIKLIPYLSPDEIERIVRRPNFWPRILFETEAGKNLLMACQNVRMVILGEILPGGKSNSYALKVCSYPIIKKWLKKEDWESISSLGIPAGLITDVFIYRMKHPPYFDWCMNTPCNNLDLQRVFDELELEAPSLHRSRIACHLYLSTQFIHPSLQRGEFRLQIFENRRSDSVMRSWKSWEPIRRALERKDDQFLDVFFKNFDFLVEDTIYVKSVLKSMKKGGAVEV